MNNVQRRLFRAFVEAGGDLGEEDQVDHLIRFVENNIMLLPQKVREAIEFVWRRPADERYDRLAAHLSERLGRPVTEPALQQRISRGLRLLEDAVRHRSWSDPATTRSTRPQR